KTPTFSLIAAPTSTLYSVSLHDALPISSQAMEQIPGYWEDAVAWLDSHSEGTALLVPSSSFATYLWGTLTDEPIQPLATSAWAVDRKSTRLNSSHVKISYAVFCLKQKKC